MSSTDSQTVYSSQIAVNTLSTTSVNSHNIIAIESLNIV